MKRILTLLLYAFTGYILFAEVVLHSADEAVTFALQNADTYVYQRLSALENMKLAKFSFRDFLPTLGVSFSESDSITINGSDSRSKTLQFSVSQMLFDGGKRKLTYDIGKMNSLFAFKEYEQVLRKFSSEIINQYFGYLKQKELVKIKEELVTAVKKQLLIVERESALGMTLETDYLEYLISYMQIENERDQYKRELVNLERKFKVALGMDRQVDLYIDDNWNTQSKFFFLEPNFDTLWALVKTKSLELAKQDITVQVTQKQTAYNKRWYLPTISLEGGMTFTGTAFPLTEPKYQVKLIFGFDNNKLFPIRLANGYGFGSNGLSSVNNSAETNILGSSTYFIEQRLADISILQGRLQRSDTETALYETLCDLIYSHDDYLLNIDLTERTIILQEKRLEFRKKELENGDIKQVDYLEDLIKFSEQKINLLELKTQVTALERSLEISTDIPFGELAYVCEKK